MKPGLIIGTIVIVFCTVIAAVALSGSSRKAITFADARRLSEPCEIYGAVVPHRTKFDLTSSRLSFALQEEKTGPVMPPGLSLGIVKLAVRLMPGPASLGVVTGRLIVTIVAAT